MLKVNGVRLRQTIAELSRFGCLSSGGISRFTFAPADLQARRYVSNLMRSSGLTVRIDSFGNIIGRMTSASEDLPTVMCGSHIDTVPNGGALDGAYGVLSGIEVARTIREQRVSLKNPLEVVVFTEEEGCRFPSCIGSLGLAGALTRDEIYRLRDRDGVTFGSALINAGIDSSLIDIPKARVIKAYVELHIEQGPVLEREKVPIGVVSSIVGLGQLEIAVEGNAGHAGTTPIKHRRDALLGACDIVKGVNKIGSKRAGTVATVGLLTVSPNASNVIPERVNLAIDFRAPSTLCLRRLQSQLIWMTRKVGKKTGLKVSIVKKSFTNSTKMSRSVMNTIVSAAQSLGLAYKEMPSGAGHDSQNMRRVTDVGMIFVPSRAGISHSARESTSPQHIDKGANVLLNTVVKLMN